MSYAVVSVMHTGTQWLMASLRAAGIRPKGCHTFGPHIDEVRAHGRVLSPMRDPVLAKISLMNRPSQWGRIEVQDFELVADMVEAGEADVVFTPDRGRVEEITGLSVPDVGVVNASEDVTGLRAEYLRGTVPESLRAFVDDLRASESVVRMLAGRPYPWMEA